MNNALYTISWSDNSFWTNSDVFSPKSSSLGFLVEIENVLKLLSDKVPILDLCCGIGAIGISSLLHRSKSFNYFYGFDNDADSVSICKKNIDFHKIDGEAYLWEAGNKLPKIEKGVAVCNPPFLSKSELNDEPIKESLVCSDNNGLEVLLKCFQSIKETGHILVLKSLKTQVPTIISKVEDHFILLQNTDHKIEQDYTIAFTIWKQR